ncbi:MAG TPA: hypothetical protein V6C89_05055 [Drouetiella sp.]
MNHNILKGCLAIALTVGLQSVCCADEVSTTTTKTEGPPVVLDSYMKPTVVQTKETTDANGNVEKSVAPIIQERHEHVMLPSSETTSTVTEHSGATQTIKTESSAVAKSTFRSAPRRVVAHRVRHHYRACTAVKPQHVAVAQKQVIEKKVIEPTIIQRQDTTVDKATVIERKDPALENQ